MIGATLDRIGLDVDELKHEALALRSEVVEIHLAHDQAWQEQQTAIITVRKDFGELAAHIDIIRDRASKDHAELLARLDKLLGAAAPVAAPVMTDCFVAESPPSGGPLPFRRNRGAVQ